MCGNRRFESGTGGPRRKDKGLEVTDHSLQSVDEHLRSTRHQLQPADQHPQSCVLGLECASRGDGPRDRRGEAVDHDNENRDRIPDLER